ncbi:hypothetical protein RRG08_053262 [Elysia crispata]|uniref:Uncharacterized protein n=1 Tax=Elysia crispata TaxID=231223 RepID=A0AAE1ANF3_9GAST|nr:hypothetical protein RRG08_053262 [Elysia crispata]
MLGMLSAPRESKTASGLSRQKVPRPDSRSELVIDWRFYRALTRVEILPAYPRNSRVHSTIQGVQSELTVTWNFLLGVVRAWRLPTWAVDASRSVDGGEREMAALSEWNTAEVGGQDVRTFVLVVERPEIQLYSGG